jgi:hypothetical protein
MYRPIFVGLLGAVIASCSGATGELPVRLAPGDDGADARAGSVDDSAIAPDVTPGEVDSSSAVPADAGPLTPVPITTSSCAADNFTQTSFVNLAPPRGEALNRTTSDAIPGDAGGTVPSGWNFYQIDGAVCRDWSQTGIYVRYTSSTKLMIYLEGGGACFSPHFCDHNPKNIHEVFQGGSLNGESFAGSLFIVAGLQAPYTDGIFDTTNSANPFRDWNQIYVPYCTGDGHFGTNASAQLPDGINPTQMNTWHFVGYRNMQKFMGRIVSTFTNLDQVILTGSSAGGLGAGFNYGMVRDAFGSVPVTLIDDSLPPFTDTQYISACLQKEVRDLWGLTAALPSDCAECANADGSGFPNIVLYWHHKYRDARFGLVSSLHDQIIRLFFSAGMNGCQQSDPNILSGLGLLGGDVPSYPGSLYEQGLTSLRTQYECTGALSSYYIGTGDPDASDSNGTIDTLHEHLFRPRFFAPLAGPNQPTLAQWTADFANGKMSQVGP